MVNDLFRLAVVGSLYTQKTVNVFHYRQTTPNVSVNSDLSECGNAWAANIQGAMIAVTSADWNLLTLEVRTVPPLGDPISGIDLGINDAGGVASASCPPTTAVVIRRRTAFLGRKYRGRIYVPGIPVASQASGVITGVTPLANFLTFANAIGTLINAGNGGSPDFQPCIVGREPVNVALPWTSWRVTDIISADFDPTLRVQRRREIGVGD